MICFNVSFKLKSDSKWIRHEFIKALTKTEAIQKVCKKINKDLLVICEVKNQGLWTDFEQNNKRTFQGD